MLFPDPPVGRSGFDVVSYFELSMRQPVVRFRSSPQPIHDVIKSRLFPMTFTTTAFDCSSSWLFEAFSCKMTSKVPPSSSAQHARLRAS